MAVIYTRKGDTGDTDLYGAGRVRKNDLRIETIGAVDELNALLGVVRMELARGSAAQTPVDAHDSIDLLLARIQHQLFDLGAELATKDLQSLASQLLVDTDILTLETSIDQLETTLEPLKHFILPGGAPSGAMAHLARAVCRRAERCLVALASVEPIREETLRYLNRLGDLLFVLARSLNTASGVNDVRWEPTHHR